MEANAAHAHHDHEMPTEGNALTGVAVSATLHCLTGCAIGEVAGMAIGTAAGFSDLGTIALAVALAFLFGYALTSLPLLRAGLVLSAVIPIALASDTISIATMEIVDNAIMLIVPGAMEAGLGNILFWGALAFALVIAFVLTVPVNRWLIARGKGHTAVHETGIHGGPPARVVGAAVILAAIFGSAVLVGEALSDDDDGHGGGHGAPIESEAPPHDGAGHDAGAALELELDQSEFSPGAAEQLSFRVVAGDGSAIRDFEVEHARRMHLIVVRHDLTGFQHLHPQIDESGTWSIPIEFAEEGAYRIFADFDRAGSDFTLDADLAVGGSGDERPLPAPSSIATTEDGYEVELGGEKAAAGEESELAFTVTRDGENVEVDPYLGADGHLVVLREGDLAYLHVHPAEHEGHGSDASDQAIRFVAEFLSEGRHRLFLQFKHEGEIHTAEFTQEVNG